MPLPNRNPREGKDDFISRCMSDSKMNSEFSDSKQRYAVCLRQFSKGEVLEVDLTSEIQAMEPCDCGICDEEECECPCHNERAKK